MLLLHIHIKVSGNSGHAQAFSRDCDSVHTLLTPHFEPRVNYILSCETACGEDVWSTSVRLVSDQSASGPGGPARPALAWPGQARQPALENPPHSTGAVIQSGFTIRLIREWLLEWCGRRGRWAD